MHFKQRELRKSFFYLFISILWLITVLTFSIIQLLQLEMQVDGLNTNNRSLQSEVKKYTRKRSMKNLLEEYPSTGLKLDKIMTDNEQTFKNKEQLEEELSDKLKPYISEAKLVISDDNNSDSLRVILTGSIETSNANLVLLGQNIVKLMRELEEIKKISEVYLTISDHEGNDLYIGIYLRNEKGEFTFQSDLRKGKG